MADEAYIVAAVRTAGGRRNGRLSGWHPADLAAEVLNALVDRVGIDPAAVEDVLMGCANQFGPQAACIGRNAVLSSKLPETVPGLSIDRQCGSSQQALHFAAQAVMSGTMDVVIAAGVECMSRVPINAQFEIAAKEGFDKPFGPKMKARYPGAVFSQYIGAEMMAKKYELSKEQLDEFSLSSHLKAIAATESKRFHNEIIPVEVRPATAKVGELHLHDEGIRFDASIEAIRGVRLLTEGGRITAASSSQICDGASGVMVVNAKGLRTLGVEPLARIHHMTVLGHDPVIVLEGPIPATERALRKSGMTLGEIDLYEVNEAFASVPLAWQKALDADPQRLNVNGGAIALGHPLGATGTKLATTLIHELRRSGKRFGLEAVCEGGGMANVTIIERL